MLESHPQGLGKPVSIGSTHDFLSDDVIGVEPCSRVFSLVGGVENPGCFLEFEGFGGIHEVIGREVGNLHARGKRVIDLQFSGFGTSCLDDDYSVGGARPVDGRCRSVFEYGNALYAVHVEVVHFFHIYFKAVEDKYRQAGFGTQVVFRYVGEAILSAYLDLRGDVIRVGTEKFPGIDRFKRGIENFQRIEKARIVDSTQFLTFYLYGSTGKTVFCFGGISGNNYVVEFIYIGFEMYAEEFFLSDFDILFFVSDERCGESGVCGFGGERETPV